MFSTVLVANRGEIAVRIFRSLRTLGVRSVAVYSDADTSARHVREADLAIRLGPAPPADSYLAIDRVIAAAVSAHAQAVHPGYGFLAENAAFSTACRDAGLTFIGPPAHAIEIMGDKIVAKRTVAAAGVPVVPGRADANMTDDALAAAADEVGYPVLIKPSAGGGGKGMRLVEDPARLREELIGARREAASSFGNDTLFLERFVPRPRHLEIQLLADAYGTVVHLGERECSLQRRHQKIVEEAPSVLLDHTMRAKMGMAAVEIARAVGYVGAGTVEFIVSADTPEEFFFMEMNTRLQVEHPVTEMVTGIDLVEEQIRVAAGEALRFEQGDVQWRGHAIEARLYAEDPNRGFLPSAGRVLALREPESEGVRVDSSLIEGGNVGTIYDPMLSKIIAWGDDRPTALVRLDRALAQTVVLGLRTNTTFLRALLRDPDVLEGRLDTELVERELHRLTSTPPPTDAYVAFALIRLVTSWPSGSTDNRWDTPDGWRFGGTHAPSSWTVDGQDGEPVVISASGTPRVARVQIGKEPLVTASVERLSDSLLVTIDGRTQSAVAVIDELTTWLWIDGATFAFREISSERRHRGVLETEGDVRSPMPGTVTAVHVAAGDRVEKGATLLIVEAMKMEYTLAAPFAGRVGEVLVRAGDKVAVDAPLTRIEPLEVTICTT